MFLSFGFRISLSDMSIVRLFEIIYEIINLKIFTIMEQIRILFMNIIEIINMLQIKTILPCIIVCIMCWWTEAILDVVQNYMIKDASPSSINR